MKRSQLHAVLPGSIAPSTVEKYTRQADENFFGFTGDEYGGMNDEMMMATGSVATSQEPYVIVVKNVGVSQQNAILFGNNVYGESDNYGSGADIRVTMAVTTVPYAQMLRQSATQPFDVVLTRVECSSAAQLARSINRKFQDASGTTSGQPITVSSYLSPDQYQSGLRDISLPYTVDGNTWLEYPVDGGAEVQFSFFVAAKVNVALPLNGAAPVKEFTRQRVRSFNPSK